MAHGGISVCDASRDAFTDHLGRALFQRCREVAVLVGEGGTGAVEEGSIEAKGSGILGVGGKNGSSRRAEHQGDEEGGHAQVSSRAIY